MSLLSFALQYSEWNASVVYAKGDKVRYNNIVYIATAANTNETPDSLLSWEVYNVLSDYITQLTISGINKAVQTFLTSKKLNQETRNLLERRTLFDGAGRLANTEINRGKLCGFEIQPVRGMGVTTKIERIGLQMKGSGAVTVYLFHSSKINPIYTETFTYDGNGSFAWFTPTQNWYMPYISSSTNSGGSWYLIYNQNDLTEGMEAVNYVRDWSKSPCPVCGGGASENWKQITKYLMVSPFNVPALQTFAEYPELWDIEDNIYTNNRNYGLNLEITVGCDLTDTIIAQRSIFADVVQKQVAYNILRLMAMNPEVRVNRNQWNVSRMDILYELDGNTSGMQKSGLGYELQQAYKALDFDTKGLDRICLSCNNGGVKYSTV